MCIKMFIIKECVLTGINSGLFDDMYAVFSAVCKTLDVVGRKRRVVGDVSRFISTACRVVVWCNYSA